MTKTVKKPAKQSSSEMERVYTLLCDMVVNGRLGQGARLVERDLAREFKTSRTPVREAIRRMEQDGLVERNKADRYARPVVAHLDPKEMEELHNIVAALEAMAARRVSELPDKERKDVVAALKTLNKEYAETCTTEGFDIEKAVECDHAFHSAYIEPGAGPRVATMRRAVKPQTERYIRTFLPVIVSQLGDSVREHEEIIAAIEAGDGDAAEAAVRKNWGNAAKRLGKAMALWNPSISK